MVTLRQAAFLLSAMFLVLPRDIAYGAPPANNYDTYFLPDTFAIDRIPVSCGPEIFVLDKTLPVAGINKGDGHIVLNPDILATMPGVMKLYVADLACADVVVGRKGNAAVVCWVVKNGRDQGWFDPPSFALLLRLLQQPEPGWPPAPSTAGIAAMQKCYSS